MSDILPSSVVTAASYTFAVTDNGTVVEGNSSSLQTFTIPTNAAAAFPVGAIFEVYQAGAAQIQVVAAAGVNLRTPNGSKTAERYATVSLRQRAVDEWVLSGDTDGVGTGPVGPAGPAGADGAQGPPGPAGGGTISDVWVWLAPATTATVGATRVGVNNDAPASATECWIHKESKNANIDYSTTISVLVSGDYVYLQAKSNAGSFHRYQVTGTPTLMGGTTWKIPVVTDSGSPSGTEPANGADVLVAFQFQPLQGPTGPAGPAGPTGATGTAGVGVPAGGTAGQALTKIDATNYNTQWATASGGGTALLGSKSYNPGTVSSVAAGTSSADVDATNLVVTFTAPSSGAVIVSLSSRSQVSSGQDHSWGVRSGGSDVAGTRGVVQFNAGSNDVHCRVTYRFGVSGLTASTSYTYTWAQIKSGGTAFTHIGGTSGAAVMEVWSA